MRRVPHRIGVSVDTQVVTVVPGARDCDGASAHEGLDDQVAPVTTGNDHALGKREG
jgi:hypothetical protein